MTKCWSKHKNESNNEEIVASNGTTIISKFKGNIVTTSSMTSMTHQTSSSVHTSKIITSEGSKPEQAFSSPKSFDEKSHNDNSFMSYPPKTATDAKPFTYEENNKFKAKPARSAFTSEPLTSRSSQPVSPIVNNRQPLPSIQPVTPIVNNRQPLPSIQPVSPIVNNRQPLLSIQTEDFNNKIDMEVTKSNKFYDDPAQSKVPVYRTRSKNRGKLLLINNINFISENSQRDGAKLDEINVIKLFKEIGFEVVKHRNLSKKKMENEIINFRNSNSLKKVDIGSVIVMSHGTGLQRSDSTEVVCTDGELLDTTWIINQFDSTLCGHLAGKPKIFIFQCCRGNGQDIQHDSVPIPISPARRFSDMLVAYSTIPGFVSHRDPKNGTWYIQAICKVFMEHSHDTDVENLLKIVDNILSNLVSTGSKQTSSFENRGFKTCFLHPKLSE